MGRGGRGGAGEDDPDDEPSHVSLAGGAVPSVAWPHPPSEDGVSPAGRSARRWSAPAVPDAVVAAPGLGYAYPPGSKRRPRQVELGRMRAARAIGRFHHLGDSRGQHVPRHPPMAAILHAVRQERIHTYETAGLAALTIQRVWRGTSTRLTCAPPPPSRSPSPLRCQLCAGENRRCTNSDPCCRLVPTATRRCGSGRRSWRTRPRMPARSSSRPPTAAGRRSGYSEP